MFQRDQSVVSRHINNVFKEGELDKESNMQKMHIANSDKPIELISKNENIENIGLTEAKGLLEIIKNYNHSFVLLNQFDGYNLKTETLNENIVYEIKHDEAFAAIV
ncbi:MAG: hypothetical protein ACJAW3_000384 [Lentimonas sp.]